ncbi:DExH-box ATP-dependent RNA helicase DExH12-like [Rosa rugosa]|uniref:DExH-box ATP-dependent RNA helicase DExH12-like n=1 Tax=Rosa rugosa TaxID=74645 RepID=UPI002B40C9F6|nr:DExH-box ATP-dependent RNA helicase DExH12-like [Rosa rugosa]
MPVALRKIILGNVSSSAMLLVKNTTKFLYEALPVESHLHHYLHDNVNAEVVAQVIGNHEGALNYLTWTFFYRRLTQNPNYYYLQGVTHAHNSEYLSELVENTLNDLETRKCVAVEDGDVSALNLGIIFSYYCISYSTIERFNSSLTCKTKMKALLEILAHASEYSQLSILPGEEEVIRRLINHHRFSFENPNFTDPHVKANALLQAHFARHHVAGDLSLDQLEVLLSASRLLHAIFDVIASNGWLNLSLLAMEVSQMVTQGMWDHDLMLLQLPHFTRELAKRCQKFPGKNIERVSDMVDMEYDERRELLQEVLHMSDIPLEDIEQFCKRFPNIGMTCKVLGSENVRAGEEVTLQVDMTVNRLALFMPRGIPGPKKRGGG